LKSDYSPVLLANEDLGWPYSRCDLSQVAAASAEWDAGHTPGCFVGKPKSHPQVLSRE
jgi:hypothetical protein